MPNGTKDYGSTGDVNEFDWLVWTSADFSLDGVWVDWNEEMIIL